MSEFKDLPNPYIGYGASSERSIHQRRAKEFAGLNVTDFTPNGGKGQPYRDNDTLPAEAAFSNCVPNDAAFSPQGMSHLLEGYNILRCLPQNQGGGPLTNQKGQHSLNQTQGGHPAAPMPRGIGGSSFAVFPKNSSVHVPPSSSGNNHMQAFSLPTTESLVPTAVQQTAQQRAPRHPSLQQTTQPLGISLQNPQASLQQNPQGPNAPYQPVFVSSPATPDPAPAPTAEAISFLLESLQSSLDPALLAATSSYLASLAPVPSTSNKGVHTVPNGHGNNVHNQNHNVRNNSVPVNTGSYKAPAPTNPGFVVPGVNLGANPYQLGHLLQEQNLQYQLQYQNEGPLAYPLHSGQKPKHLRKKGKEFEKSRGRNSEASKELEKFRTRNDGSVRCKSESDDSGSGSGERGSGGSGAGDSGTGDSGTGDSGTGDSRTGDSGSGDSGSPGITTSDSSVGSSPPGFHTASSSATAQPKSKQFETKSQGSQWSQPHLIGDFSRWSLSPWLSEAVYKLNFEEPTSIQRELLPTILSGKNVVVSELHPCTGKTSGVVIAAAQLVNWDDNVPQVLLVSATRELAQYTYQLILKLCEKAERGRSARERCCLLVGQTRVRDSVKTFENGGKALVVATTGRLYDLVRRGVLRAATVKLVALDEAEAIMQHVLIPKLFALLPVDVQWVALCASITPKVQVFLQTYLRDPVCIQGKALVGSDIEHLLVTVADLPQKISLVEKVCEVVLSGTVIVFCSVVGRKALDCHLKEKYKPLENPHENVTGYATSTVNMYIASDALARGVGMADVAVVINLGLPPNAVTYAQRAGRGCGLNNIAHIVVVNLVDEEEKEKVAEIEKFCGVKMMNVSWERAVLQSSLACNVSTQ